MLRTFSHPVSAPWEDYKSRTGINDIKYGHNLGRTALQVRHDLTEVTANMQNTEAQRLGVGGCAVETVTQDTLKTPGKMQYDQEEGSNSN